ncbi:MAG: hypothetical protein OEY33_08170 [Bdellovibrionales bacterium]|jgi:hypothetical protein|nr:hypothetical protein [Bdellovibrionales bacterium]
MEEQLYSNLAVKQSSKQKKHNLSFMDSEKPNLQELRKKDIRLISKQDLIEAYIQELKALLDIDTLEGLTKALLGLDRTLEELKEDLEIEMISKCPNLNSLYQKLSPVLLRAYLEKNRVLEDSWLEAMRVAIEQEIIALS